MNDVEVLSHTKWKGKYHIGFIHSEMSQESVVRWFRQQLGEVLEQLAMQPESRIEEGHLMGDHVHMLVSILPQYCVSTVGRDEKQVREYLQKQEQASQRIDQLTMFNK
ncbi:MAG: IS200/IS605 family transposase [Acidobacteria bacterium]|nr:IS200/IS605 family transposase [Acidobacteriota bacterium]